VEREKAVVFNVARVTVTLRSTRSALRRPTFLWKCDLLRADRTIYFLRRTVEFTPKRYV
jgi:hypothetical protein